MSVCHLAVEVFVLRNPSRGVQATNIVTRMGRGLRPPFPLGSPPPPTHTARILERQLPPSPLPSRFFVDLYTTKNLRVRNVSAADRRCYDGKYGIAWELFLRVRQTFGCVTPLPPPPPFVSAPESRDRPGVLSVSPQAM